MRLSRYFDAPVVPLSAPGLLIVGTVENDTLVGSSADDQINGREGSDSLSGGAGDDTLWGGGHWDRLQGEAGDDVLVSGGVGGWLEGGDGNDRLFSDAQYGRLVGGAGDDVIHGKFDERIDAGEGHDYVVVDTATQVALGAGDDFLVVHRRALSVTDPGGRNTMYGGEYGDAFSVSGVNTVFGRGGNDSIESYGGDSVLDGGDGADRVVGYGGSNCFIGGLGDDILIAHDGLDLLDGGAGDDRIFSEGNGNDIMVGGEGLDWFGFETPQAGNNLVVDFNLVQDRLLFSGAAFGGYDLEDWLVAGQNLIVGSQSAVTHQIPTFFYDVDDGSVYFDADGTGSLAYVFIVRLNGAPAIGPAHFAFY